MGRPNLREQNLEIKKIRITFGLIVLNGMPFIKYNLRALYPYAHQIIVVEGAAPSSKNVASDTGHSLDGTLEMLLRFQEEEDPEGKVTVVIAEDNGNANGFWSEKDEMSQAYAKLATGNYLWQIDCDEFYLEGDMERIIKLLKDDPEIKAVSFSMHTFWGSPDYIVNGYFLDKFIVHRIFAWGPGYKYLSHRPVTIVDDTSKDLRSFKWLTPEDMRTKGIYMYHYELLFPKQVIEKCGYYAGVEWTTVLKEANEWVHNCYLRLGKPFRVHMMYKHISWLEHFKGKHPVQVQKMVNAVIPGGYEHIALRNMDDAERLLSTIKYQMQCMVLKGYIPFDRMVNKFKNQIRRTIAGRILINIKNGIKGQLTPIERKDVSKRLVEGWKSPSIPVKQRQLTDLELANMYGGNAVKPFRVLADCIKTVGGEMSTMIEIGCSTGYYFEVLSYLLKQKVNYTGVDYSESMIKEASMKYPDAAFLEADATRLPYSNNSFDIAISGCCLLHIPDYAKAISESARIASNWVIFHRTPIVQGPTRYFKKKAYGVPCVEIHFNEAGFIDMCRENGLELKLTYDVANGEDFSQKTYAFKKTEQEN